MQHFLVHGDLLVERAFDSVPFQLDLSESFLHEAVHGFKFPEFAGSLLSFPQSGSLSIDDIVCQFAGSVGHVCPRSLAVLFR